MKQRTLSVCLLAMFLLSAMGNYLYLLKVAVITPPPTVTDLGLEILHTHSVLAAVLIGGIFAKRRSNRKVDPSLVALSFALSLLWVLYMGSTWLGYPNVFNADGKGGLLDQMNQHATAASVLVGAMLAFVSGSTPKD